MDWSAPLVHRIRSVLQGLYRGHQSGPDHRIPVAESGLPTLGTLLHRLLAACSRFHSWRGRKAAGGAVNQAGGAIAGFAEFRSDFRDFVARGRGIPARYPAAM